MALPASYTEAELAAYMHSVLGSVATALGWSVAGESYVEPVNETLAAYGVDDIAAISGRANIVKLRALARREVWRAVVAQSAAHYDVTADGASLTRSQIQAQAREQLRLAEIDCLTYDPAYRVSVTGIDHNDPYKPEEIA